LLRTEAKEKAMNRIAIAAIASSFALTGTAPAQAGVTVGIHVGSHRPGVYATSRYRVDRIAFDNGYRDGLREGQKDDRHNDRYYYRDEKRYRQGDAGYRREHGPRHEYVNAYRRGFEEGYRRGYSDRRSHDDRYDRYDRYDRR
jgi:hypothetical protein